MAMESDHKVIFYEKLAHLFYAVAMADKKMVVEEKRKIVSYVEKYWSHSFDKKERKEIIYEIMRKLIKKQMTSEDAYEVFKSYYQTKSNDFSKDLCQKIMEAADGIATSSSKRNKSELVFLTKLHKLLFEN
ncbi:TerB family tellurite resistance protein [Aquimarina latercula]|uniref:TerB family tellurite resistance protein n=1 Tax=Aquimarina latercula TaxID=987 RepID=UPI000412F86D|nr:TerB family tellurite resistance protein [Aquimarina latercula]